MAQINEKNDGGAFTKKVYYNTQYDQNGQLTGLADMEKEDFQQT